MEKSIADAASKAALYQSEFPNFLSADMPEIPAGWTDVSFRNDACPSFQTPNGLIVYVDCAAPESREVSESSRYSVSTESDSVFESDEWSEVLAYVLAREFAMRLKAEIRSQNFAIAASRNARESNRSVCHSHDFCDANMIMESAFISVMGFEPLGDTGMTDSTLALWNAAWHYAAPRLLKLAEG